MSDAAANSILAEGFEAHRKGDLKTALARYEAALAENPADPDALSVYGMALLHARRTDEAEAPLVKAIELSPESPGYHANLAEYCRATGQIDRAIEELETATRLAPDFAKAWQILGESLIAKREYEKAAEALDRALILDSGNLALALRLARAHAAAGNYPAAFYALEHADKLKPDAPETLQVRLDFARVNRDWPTLERTSQQLLSKQPKNAAAWRDLALAFYESARLRASLEAFENVLKFEGRTPPNLTAYASVALRAGLTEKASAALEEADRQKPNAALRSTQSLHRLQEGDIEQALSLAEEAVLLDPDYLPVYPHLSALRKGKLKESEIEALTRRVEEASRSPAERSMASFVLAHHHDAKGDIDRAFQEYARANAFANENRRLENVEYDASGAEQRIKSIWDRFSDQEDFAAATSGAAESPATPIFIMGAPRSGTTLLESVVGAHSGVHAGGELPAMATLLELFMQRGAFAGPLSEDERAHFAGAYWAQAPALDGARFMTDKGLLNADAVGLIAQLFPASPIIRVRRNPVETALSIYRHEFTKYWAFTGGFEDIAHFLALREKTAAHWESVLGDRFVTVQYEPFVENFDAEARRLVELCGLDWEEGCAERGKPGSAASTISAVQVREPVSLSGRAQAYAAHIEPLLRALEAAGLDLETGALKS